MVGRIYLDSRGEYVNSLDNLLPNFSLERMVNKQGRLAWKNDFVILYHCSLRRGLP
jgi:hypothetical protein